MIVCFLLAGLFLVQSVVLFLGKGGWLIAGYNTLSDEEKKKYNEKKLCKTTGFICLSVAIFLGALGLYVYVFH